MVMSKRDDTMQLRMRILIVMAESLLPLKGGCPNIHNKGHIVQNQVFYLEVDQKGSKMWKCSGRSAYVTHWNLILWRSRVGNGLRPKVCMHAFHSCKSTVLGFSRVL